MPLIADAFERDAGCLNPSSFTAQGSLTFKARWLLRMDDGEDGDCWLGGSNDQISGHNQLPNMLLFATLLAGCSGANFRSRFAVDFAGRGWSRVKVVRLTVVFSSTRHTSTNISHTAINLEHLQFHEEKHHNRDVWIILAMPTQEQDVAY